MIPNTRPDGQVRVIPDTVVVDGVAVERLLSRDAVVVRFPAGPFRANERVLTHWRLSESKSLSESESFPERQLPLDGVCFGSWGP